MRVRVVALGASLTFGALAVAWAQRPSSASHVGSAAHAEHVRHAVQLAEGGFDSKAKALAFDLEGEEPSCPHAPLLLASIAIDEGRWDDALRDAQKLSQLEPENGSGEFLSALAKDRRARPGDSWARSTHRAWKTLPSGTRVAGNFDPPLAPDAKTDLERAPTTLNERLFLEAANSLIKVPLRELNAESVDPGLALSAIGHRMVDQLGEDAGTAPDPELRGWALKLAEQYPNASIFRVAAISGFDPPRTPLTHDQLLQLRDALTGRPLVPQSPRETLRACEAAADSMGAYDRYGMAYMAALESLPHSVIDRAITK